MTCSRAGGDATSVLSSAARAVTAPPNINKPKMAIESQGLLALTALAAHGPHPVWPQSIVHLRHISAPVSRTFDGTDCLMRPPILRCSIVDMFAHPFG
jgi:hypothetical protein